jgi:hypothetical protein
MSRKTRRRSGCREVAQRNSPAPRSGDTPNAYGRCPAVDLQWRLPLPQWPRPSPRTQPEITQMRFRVFRVFRGELVHSVP